MKLPGMATGPATAPSPRRWRRLSADERFGYLLIAPILLWLAIVLFYPLGYVIVLSFFRQEAAGAALNFAGFEFFKNVILKDKLFWSSVHHSLSWTVGNVVLQFIVGIGVALFLRQSFRGNALVRLWVIVPWITPVVVTTLIWRWMLNPTLGVVESLLRNAGLLEGYINLLGNVSTVMGTLVGVHSWRYFPFVTVVVLGRLLGIPEELYEAAKVDGASGAQRFFYITLPQIRGVLVTFTMLATLWTFTVFDSIFLMTGGGPIDATTTLPILVYRRAFQSFQMNQAAALSVIMFLVAFVFVMAYVRLGGEE
jgi:multiple sugar transport system permease protein